MGRTGQIGVSGTRPRDGECNVQKPGEAIFHQRWRFGLNGEQPTILKRPLLSVYLPGEFLWCARLLRSPGSRRFGSKFKDRYCAVRPRCSTTKYDSTSALKTAYTNGCRA